MATVLLLRGVNVGGHKTFKPSELARKLSHLDAVSIGAAGTFVIHRSMSQTALKSEVQRHLPFEAESMMCSGREVLGLMAADTYAQVKVITGVKRYATILARKPVKNLKPPVRRPETLQWQVKIIQITGRWVFSLHRSVGKRLIYPNEVVEEVFEMPATTRNWNTLIAVAEAIRAGPPLAVEHV